MVQVYRRAGRSTGRYRAERPRAALANSVVSVLICLAVAACSGASSDDVAAVPAVSLSQAIGTGPRIVTPQSPLQCVPYARTASGVRIRGDADTWWRQAEGRYDRGRQPTVGSVLVLKPNGGSRGHVAVVTAIRSTREIIVDHANWLNRGRIHLGTPVRDVSGANDWSAVRLWYTPGGTYGARAYAAHGFIYPRLVTAAR